MDSIYLLERMSGVTPPKVVVTSLTRSTLILTNTHIFTFGEATVTKCRLQVNLLKKTLVATVLDVFWTSYLGSIYVLCLRGRSRINFPLFFCAAKTSPTFVNVSRDNSLKSILVVWHYIWNLPCNFLDDRYDIKTNVSKETQVY